MNLEQLRDVLSPEAFAALTQHAEDHGIRSRSNSSLEEDSEVSSDADVAPDGSVGHSQIDYVSREEDCGNIPRDNRVYKRKDYWEERFAREEAYDWLVTYSEVSELLAAAIPNRETARILMVGCGNSSFSSDMYAAGFKHITNIDFSSVVIKKMMEKHKDKPEMTWVVQDMCDLSLSLRQSRARSSELGELDSIFKSGVDDFAGRSSHMRPAAALPSAATLVGAGPDNLGENSIGPGFEDGSFDVVLDKAAMDALMTDEGDVWNPAAHVVSGAHAMCSGVSTVLAPGGTFIQISFAQPHFRRRYLLGEHASQSAALMIQTVPTGAGGSVDYGWTYEQHRIGFSLLSPTFFCHG